MNSMLFEELELTMSHTSLGSLNEFTLMVLFGNVHSHRLVHGLDINPSQILADNGRSLYPAYFVTKLQVPINNLLKNFKLWDRLKIGVDVVRYGETLLESNYIVGHLEALNKSESGDSTLVDKFPTMKGSNLIVVEEMNGETGKRQVANPSQNRIAKIERTKKPPFGLLNSKNVRRMGADYFEINPQFRNEEPIVYMVNPRRDAVNGHAMIFAKYAEIMDVIEYDFFAKKLFPRFSLGLLETLEVLEREIYYYGNCFAGEEIDISLLGEVELTNDNELVDEIYFVPAGYLHAVFELFNKRTGNIIAVCKVTKVFAIPMKDQELISDLHRTIQTSSYIYKGREMDSIKTTINAVLREIQERNSYPLRALNEDIKVVDGLGFTSLDVAELVAILEIETDVDPFANGISIMDVHTVGDLYRAYEVGCNASD